MDKEKLLLICPDFYDYSKYLHRTLNKCYDVITVPVKYTDANLMSRRGKQISTFFKKNNRSKWLHKSMTELSKLVINKILIISLFPYPTSLLDILKHNNPNLETYVFLWDELEKIPQIHNILKYADYLFSFNSLDIPQLSELSGLPENRCKYLPNFYIPRESTNKEIRYTIGFIGTVNPDTLNRLAIVEKLWQWCRDHEIEGNFYLRYHDYWHGASIWKRIYIRLFNKEYYDYITLITSMYGDRQYLHRNPLSIEEVLNFEDCTDCIVDIGHIKRQGYTLNVISALGNDKRLLTTNPYIKKEPFFSTENILIIDDKLENLDVSFFKTNKKKVALHCLEINNWVKMIFDESYYKENIDSIYR